MIKWVLVISVLMLAACNQYKEDNIVEGMPDQFCRYHHPLTRSDSTPVVQMDFSLSDSMKGVSLLQQIPNFKCSRDNYFLLDIGEGYRYSMVYDDYMFCACGQPYLVGKVFGSIPSVMFAIRENDSMVLSHDTDPRLFHLDSVNQILLSTLLKELDTLEFPFTQRVNISNTVRDNGAQNQLIRSIYDAIDVVMDTLSHRHFGHPYCQIDSTEQEILDKNWSPIVYWTMPWRDFY